MEDSVKLSLGQSEKSVGFLTEKKSHSKSKLEKGQHYISLLCVTCYLNIDIHVPFLTQTAVFT